MKSFFIVFGTELELDHSNCKVITSEVIPNDKDIIKLKDGLYQVTLRFINYINVEDFDDLTDENRGGEIIYIYVEKI